MFEKVNKYHPDKIADRIAGAIVDLAYNRDRNPAVVMINPTVAVEVLIGHGVCNVMIESSVEYTQSEIEGIVHRIAGEDIAVNLICKPQDSILAKNQENVIRCGDNGIFRGVPISGEEQTLAQISRNFENTFKSDGKYILDDETGTLIVCQSNITSEQAEAIKRLYEEQYNLSTIVNPLGEWTGGTDVDCGATNRKLGSDMGQSVTGGGLHGKDLSKADVSVNIYAWYLAQQLNNVVELFCAIGDTEVTCKIADEITKVPYKTIVERANYINRQNSGSSKGFFERLAEHGLIW